MRVERCAGGVLLAVALLGCDEEKPATPAASAKASASASAAPPEKPKPWFEGTWTGSYEAKKQPIEMSKKEGAVWQWEKDDGGTGSGKGTLSLTVAEDGAITGTASGALGEQVVSGRVVDEEFRLRLKPKDMADIEAFGGTMTGKRDGDEVKGELKASSGDSINVRKASVTLEKQGAAAAAGSAKP